MPYLELITRNGLAERIEGGVPRYKTTAKGTKRSVFQGAGETTHAAASKGLVELGSYLPAIFSIMRERSYYEQGRPGLVHHYKEHLQTAQISAQRGLLLTITTREKIFIGSK
jgi:hypothetical protein